MEIEKKTQAEAEKNYETKVGQEIETKTTGMKEYKSRQERDNSPKLCESKRKNRRGMRKSKERKTGFIKNHIS